MAKFSQIKINDDPIPLEVDGIDGFYIRNIPFSQFKKLEEEFNKSSKSKSKNKGDKFFLTLCQTLICDKKGESFEEFTNAKSIEDLGEHLTMQHISALSTAILRVLGGNFFVKKPSAQKAG